MDVFAKRESRVSAGTPDDNLVCDGHEVEGVGRSGLPAQFTSLLGAGRLLYACHSKDAALARLLRENEASCQPITLTSPHFRPP